MKQGRYRFVDGKFIHEDSYVAESTWLSYLAGLVIVGLIACAIWC